ncbi:hypothetical protein MPSI1_001878 [Malassezia psittaci]|uniref:GATA-type domain-containing protein n=1 Tax=Malassezia psittaci TaxID=1821823 RepID=A0AAF0F550_9BASI|nr:hypothetical protein MPSI1_001878 [Malassezia psittaci]
MTNQSTENILPSERNASPHSGPVSEERVSLSVDKPTNEPMNRASYRHGSSSIAPGLGQSGYASPSPPPPAPAVLSSTASQGGAYESQNERTGRSTDASVVNTSNQSYPAGRAPGTPNALSNAPASPAMASWPTTMHGTLESNSMFSLERIHAASLALYNYASEHLERQMPIVPEDLYELLPIGSEINQELRSLLAVHEGRTPREAATEMPPYYPWTSGNGTAHTYWLQNARDDRDGKQGRGDDNDADDKSNYIRRRDSGPGKIVERFGPRSVRGMSGSDEFASYNPNITGHGLRNDSMYLPPTSSSHGVHKAGTGDSSTGQYVPKYRKRSRAPAPGVCHACGNSDTPEWRRGPDGARTLCNACGLHFSKLVRRRTLEYANAAPGTPIPPVTTAELRASTNAGNNPNLNVSASTPNPTGELTEGPNTVYGDPLATSSNLRTNMPNGPGVDENLVSTSANAPPPHALSQLSHVDLSGTQNPTKLSEQMVEGYSRRPAMDPNLAEANKSARTN